MLAEIAYPTIVKIHIGPFAISPHGVGIAVGFLLGARLMLPEAERKGISESDVYPLLTRAAIGAIIGARLAYVVSHLTSDATQVGYLHHPFDVFKVWQGGISLLGGIIGAILLALPEMRKRRLSFWKLMDAAAPGIALGVIIGRIGDLIVGDHLGKQNARPTSTAPPHRASRDPARSSTRRPPTTSCSPSSCWRCCSGSGASPGTTAS